MRASLSRGFTLIELMITVALSSLVGILIYTVFISQTQAFRVQADMGAMQQNLRVAMEMLTRDLATAGWGMGSDGGTWGVGGQAGVDSDVRYGLRIIDDFPSGGGSDAVEIITMSPDRNTWGYTAPGTLMQCDTQIITFDEDWIDRAALFALGTSTDQIICFNPAGRAGRAASYIWDVAGNGDAATGTIPVDVNTQQDYIDRCERSLPDQLICGPAVHVAYYVDRDSSDGIGFGSADLPVLYLVPDVDAAELAGGYPESNDIPVAMGIENVQFQLCEAGSGVDCDDPLSWTSGYDMTDTSGHPFENLSGIRVHVTARTIRPDENRASVSQPLDPLTGGVLGPLDAYHRRVARTEVTMRNALGTWQAARAPY